MKFVNDLAKFTQVEGPRRSRGPVRTRYAESATRAVGLGCLPAEGDVLELGGLREVPRVQDDGGESLVRLQLRHGERFGGVRANHVARHERQGLAVERDGDVLVGPVALDGQAVDRHRAVTRGEGNAERTLTAAGRHRALLVVGDGVEGCPLGVDLLRHLDGDGLGIRTALELADGDCANDEDDGHARHPESLPLEDAHARNFIILCNYLQYFSNHRKRIALTAGCGKGVAWCESC